MGTYPFLWGVKQRRKGYFELSEKRKHCRLELDLHISIGIRYGMMSGGRVWRRDFQANETAET